MYGIKQTLTKEMSLEDYLEIIKKSKYPFDYLVELKKFKKRNGFLNLLFSEEEINEFCSEHVYHDLKRNTYYVDIKKIEPKKYQYAYEGEKEAFDRIDKLWKERDYRGVINECDTLLRHFIKKLYEIETGKEFSFTDGKKDQEIETILEKITFQCELPQLKDSLSNVIKEFNNMRNKLKDKPPYKSEQERWKKFNELPEIKKILYTRMIVDLLKSLHNSLLIIQRDWEKFLGK